MAHLKNNLKIWLVFSILLNLLWEICDAFGKIFIVLIGQK